MTESNYGTMAYQWRVWVQAVELISLDLFAEVASVCGLPASIVRDAQVSARKVSIEWYSPCLFDGSSSMAIGSREEVMTQLFDFRSGVQLALGVSHWSNIEAWVTEFVETDPERNGAIRYSECFLDHLIAWRKQGTDSLRLGNAASRVYEEYGTIDNKLSIPQSFLTRDRALDHITPWDYLALCGQGFRQINPNSSYVPFLDHIEIMNRTFIFQSFVSVIRQKYSINLVSLLHLP